MLMPILLASIPTANMYLRKYRAFQNILAKSPGRNCAAMNVPLVKRWWDLMPRAIWKVLVRFITEIRWSGSSDKGESWGIWSLAFQP